MPTSNRWTSAFFQAHPVFRTEQFLSAAPSTAATAHALLRAHRAGGRLTNLRRGLWAVNEPGSPPVVDAYAVASLATNDAILGLRSAMQLHGFGYAMHSVVTYYASSPAARFECQGTLIRGLKHPIRLVEQGVVDLETVVVDRMATPVRVTSLERTLVDMLDRQDLSGGIEETWRTAEQLGWLDDRRLLRYVHARRSAVLAARVGYVIDNMPELGFPAASLDELRTIATTLSPGPFELAPHERGERRYVHAWRLRVPQAVVDRSWEEPCCTGSRSSPPAGSTS